MASRARAQEPLGFADPEAPPLSPSTARDLADVLAANPACGDNCDEGELQNMKPEPEWEPSVLSPSPEAMATAARRRHQVTNMRLNETKEDVLSGGILESVKERRAQRSAIERKSRQRRMGALRRMRREVKQLEDVYAGMLKQNNDSVVEGVIGAAQDVVVRPAQRSVERTAYASPTVEVWKRKYSELTLVAHALEEDQEKLQNLLQQHKAFRQSVQGSSEEDYGGGHHMTTQGEGRGEFEASTAVYDTGVPYSSSQDVVFRQRSIPECYTFLRDSYDIFQRFHTSDEYQSTGACFMGWTDKRKYDPKTDAIHYGCTKTFPLEKDAELLLMRTWETMMDPAIYGRVLLDANTGQRFQMLQELGDDFCIFRRDHKRPRTPQTFVLVTMAFRIETPEGFLMFIRSIPAPEIKNAMQPHEFFFEHFTWVHFTQLRDEYGSPTATKIVMGGSIKNAKMLMSHAWLFEIMSSTLRWESHCVAPIFLKNI